MAYLMAVIKNILLKSKSTRMKHYILFVIKTRSYKWHFIKIDIRGRQFTKIETARDI